MTLEESRIVVVAVVVVASCPTTGAVESVEGQHIRFLIPKAHSSAGICLSFLIHFLKRILRTGNTFQSTHVLRYNYYSMTIKTE